MEAPPAYEQFTIEEPNSGNPPGRISKIFRPVMRVVDPVAKKWAEASAIIEELVSKVMHPLLAKRIFFLITVLVVFFVLYSQGPNPEISFEQRDQMQSFLNDEIKPERIRHTAEYLNSIPHVAGTVSGHTSARYIHDALVSYGFERVETSPHDVFLTHLESHSLKLEHNGEVLEIGLEEGSATDKEQPPTHMSLGISGDAKGKLIYANFGTRSDLNYLRAQGLSIKDKIVVLRFGKGTPGLTVERLQEWGASGVIFFSYKQPGVAPWPLGPDYSEDSVQRACLGIPQLWPGDPLSPGWPSNHHLTVPLENVRSIAKIPVLSVSWKQIGPLLASLKGYGVKQDDWHNSGYPRDVEEWWTGDESENAPSAAISITTVNEDRHAIYNVLARLTGSEQSDRGVFIGASHDSFCNGGVKISGVTVLLEVARALSYLSYEHNWKPLRSIYFTFWDGSTQNYAGATEWMENLSGRVSEDGIIYIDLDKGISGNNLFVEGSPTIDIRELVSKIDSNLKVDEQYRHIPWDFGTSDVFSSYVGVPAISLGMTGEVYPKDSCFDSLDWQNKFGDSDFSSHKKLGDIAASIVYQYADTPIMPFNFTYFASQTETYIEDLEDYISSKLGPKQKSGYDAILSESRDALAKITQGGQRADGWRDSWSLDLKATEDKKESSALHEIRIDWNDRMNQFFKRFLNRPGLYHRDWFKNLIFGPKYESDQDSPLSGTFPGVRDIVWLSRVDLIEEALHLVADSLKDAAQTLLDAPYWN